MPLSTAVRQLVVERVREIDQASELSAAEQWQRAQAWSEWEKLRSADAGEATREDLASEFEHALRRRDRAGKPRK